MPEIHLEMDEGYFILGLKMPKKQVPRWTSQSHKMFELRRLLRRIRKLLFTYIRCTYIRKCIHAFCLLFQMYITNTIKAKGTRLAKPVLCLGLMCLAFLTGLNRVAEYRNHWSDVIAGFLVGISIAVFLVSTSFFRYNLFVN